MPNSLPSTSNSANRWEVHADMQEDGMHGIDGFSLWVDGRREADTFTEDYDVAVAEVRELNAELDALDHA